MSKIQIEADLCGSEDDVDIEDTVTTIDNKANLNLTTYQLELQQKPNMEEYLSGMDAASQHLMRQMLSEERQYAAHGSLSVKTTAPRTALAVKPHTTGKWTDEEADLYQRGLEIFGEGAWHDIAEVIQTKSAKQVKSYAVRLKLRKKMEGKNVTIIEPDPPPCDPSLPTAQPTVSCPLPTKPRKRKLHSPSSKHAEKLLRSTTRKSASSDSDVEIIVDDEEDGLPNSVRDYLNQQLGQTSGATEANKREGTGSDGDIAKQLPVNRSPLSSRVTVSTSISLKETPRKIKMRKSPRRAKSELSSHPTPDTSGSTLPSVHMLSGGTMHDLWDGSQGGPVIVSTCSLAGDVDADVDKSWPSTDSSICETPNLPDVASKRDISPRKSEPAAMLVPNKPFINIGRGNVFNSKYIPLRSKLSAPASENDVKTRKSDVAVDKNDATSDDGDVANSNGDVIPGKALTDENDVITGNSDVIASENDVTPNDDDIVTREGDVSPGKLVSVITTCKPDVITSKDDVILDVKADTSVVAKRDDSASTCDVTTTKHDGKLGKPDAITIDHQVQNLPASFPRIVKVLNYSERLKLVTPIPPAPPILPVPVIDLNTEMTYKPDVNRQNYKLPIPRLVRAPVFNPRTSKRRKKKPVPRPRVSEITKRSPKLAQLLTSPTAKTARSRSAPYLCSLLTDDNHVMSQEGTKSPNSVMKGTEAKIALQSTESECLTPVKEEPCDGSESDCELVSTRRAYDNRVETDVASSGQTLEAAESDIEATVKLEPLNEDCDEGNKNAATNFTVSDLGADSLKMECDEVESQIETQSVASAISDDGESLQIKSEFDGDSSAGVESTTTLDSESAIPHSSSVEKSTPVKKQSAKTGKASNETSSPVEKGTPNENSLPVDEPCFETFPINGNTKIHAPVFYPPTVADNCNLINKPRQRRLGAWRTLTSEVTETIPPADPMLPVPVTTLVPVSQNQEHTLYVNPGSALNNSQADAVLIPRERSESVVPLGMKLPIILPQLEPQPSVTIHHGKKYTSILKPLLQGCNRRHSDSDGTETGVPINAPPILDELRILNIISHNDCTTDNSGVAEDSGTQSESDSGFSDPQSLTSPPLVATKTLDKTESCRVEKFTFLPTIEESEKCDILDENSEGLELGAEVEGENDVAGDNEVVTVADEDVKTEPGDEEDEAEDDTGAVDEEDAGEETEDAEADAVKSDPPPGESRFWLKCGGWLTLPAPTRERSLPPDRKEEDEMTAFPDKAEDEYLKIRNHIVSVWQSVRPQYVNKVRARHKLRTDVTYAGIVHGFLERTGVINFGCSECQYNTEIGWKPKIPRDIFVPAETRESSSRRRKVRLRCGHYCDPDDQADPCQVCATQAERRPKPVKKKTAMKTNPFKLVRCKTFGECSVNQPYRVEFSCACLATVLLHSLVRRVEVIGLLGGSYCADGEKLTIEMAEPCHSLSTEMQCEMDPVSQAEAASVMRGQGWDVVGWYHSHPTFPPHPSIRDLETQHFMQEYFACRGRPFVGVITSPNQARNPVVHCLIAVTDSSSTTGSPYLLDCGMTSRERTPSSVLWEKFMRIIRAAAAPDDVTMVDVTSDGGQYLDRVKTFLADHLSARYEDAADISELVHKCLLRSSHRTGTTPPQQAGTTSPQQAGTSSPNQAGTSSPNQAGTSSPQQAGTSSLNQVGTSSPNQAGTSSPNQAGTSSPNQAGTSSPNQAGTSFPNQAGTSSLNQAGTSFPYQVGTSSPNQAGTSSPNQAGTEDVPTEQQHNSMIP